MKQIILEGADACGKSTLAKNLVERIQERYPNMQVRVVREPGNAIKGLRQICLKAPALDIDGKAAGKPTPLAHVALFLAGMIQTNQAVQAWGAEVAARDQEALVIRDRSILSTLIYQGFLGAGPAGVRSIWAMYHTVLDETFDKVFILLGSHKHQGAQDHHTELGHHPHIQNLYATIQKLLSPLEVGGLDGRSPVLVREMAKAMSRADRLAFHHRFPSWHYVNTNELDSQQAAEFAFLHLRKSFKWT